MTETTTSPARLAWAGTAPSATAIVTPLPVAPIVAPVVVVAPPMVNHIEHTRRRVVLHVEAAGDAQQRPMTLHSFVERAGHSRRRRAGFTRLLPTSWSSMPTLFACC